MIDRHATATADAGASHGFKSGGTCIMLRVPQRRRCALRIISRRCCCFRHLPRSIPCHIQTTHDTLCSKKHDTGRHAQIHGPAAGAAAIAAESIVSSPPRDAARHPHPPPPSSMMPPRPAAAISPPLAARFLDGSGSGASGLASPSPAVVLDHRHYLHSHSPHSSFPQVRWLAFFRRLGRPSGPQSHIHTPHNLPTQTHDPPNRRTS